MIEHHKNLDAPKNLVSLTQMKRGQVGVVILIDGGEKFAQRLSSLGVRINKEITKISAMVLNGPVVVGINNRHIAIGFKMASKIYLEVK